MALEWNEIVVEQQEGREREGKEASWDTRVNLSPRSIPSTGRVSMRKKKKKEKIYSSLRKSTCHDEKLLRFSYWRLLKCVHDFFFFKFPKTFLELRLRLLSIFRSKSKYTKDSAPRISKIFKINILARKRIKQSLPSNFHGKNPLSFSSIVESSNIASNVCFQKKTETRAWLTCVVQILSQCRRN